MVHFSTHYSFGNLLLFLWTCWLTSWGHLCLETFRLLDWPFPMVNYDIPSKALYCNTLFSPSTFSPPVWTVLPGPGQLSNHSINLISISFKILACRPILSVSRDVRIYINICVYMSPPSGFFLQGLLLALRSNIQFKASHCIGQPSFPTYLPCPLCRQQRIKISELQSASVDRFLVSHVWDFL